MALSLGMKMNLQLKRYFRKEKPPHQIVSVADKAKKNITAELKINGIREGAAVTVAD